MALEFQGVLEKTDKVVDDNDMGKCVDNDRERGGYFLLTLVLPSVCLRKYTAQKELTFRFSSTSVWETYT
ncbi:MAG: hypothetical protein ACLUGJ_11565 [Blautia wexlerae]